MQITKQSQLHSVRVKPTQRMMGAISPKVRETVKERSQGVCEVRLKCNGMQAMEMAHIVGRKQLDHITTEKDILHSCIHCHRFLDQTSEGIRWKKKLLEGICDGLTTG